MSELLNIKYEKFILDNGLEVILYPNFSFPTVSVNLWYKVGSANEHPQNTGFAHLFEHMMFQGSKNIEKEMHFKYIQEAGGTLNGSTSMDRTNYYESLPSDSLELALWLESDRMGFLIDALTQDKLDNQKEVVMNERRQNYDNQPYGLAWEIIFSNLFPEDHPYHWPTIGWMKDIEKFQMNDVKHFFEEYYSPNNASLVIGGSFNNDKAHDLIKKYFNPIKKGLNPKPVTTSEISLKETKLISHSDNVQLTKLYYAWHSDKGYGEDDSALDILSDILANSKSSRLYRKLVHDLKICLDVSAFQYSAKYSGVFFIVVTLKPNVESDLVHDKIMNSISKIINHGVTQSEMERAVNGFKSSYIYSLQNIDNLTNQINNYNCNLNEPNSFIYDLNRYNNLNVDRVRDAAEIYLAKNYLRLAIVPKN